MRIDVRRRLLLRGALAAPAILASRVSLAAPEAGAARFVLVILRGALDGLAAAPPVGDPHYGQRRGELAFAGQGQLQRLDDLFALHPALVFLGEQWRARRMTLLHATATPYRERSHFDAQDVLESGLSRPHAIRSGWLNRALAALPRAQGSALRPAGVALGPGVPLVMRGAVEVASWAPSRLPHLEDDTLQRLADLYADDALLARRLADATAAQQLAGESGMDGGRLAAAQFSQAAATAAGFLRQPDGPRVAVLETTGWDTHANQGSAQGALAQRLGALDAGLGSLAQGLGDAWRQTAVLVVTEFGRTVAVNGTRGTDHGTASAAFLVGGAVRGGRVVADWPGLADNALHQGRDLAPTLDLRAVTRSLLRDHLQVPAAHLQREVFPDAAALRWIDDLV